MPKPKVQIKNKKRKTNNPEFIFNILFFELILNFGF